MVEPQNAPLLILDAEQYGSLEQLASKQNRTISNVAREVVRLGLEYLELRQTAKKRST